MALTISVPRSVIPSCDVDVSVFRSIVEQTHDIPKVGAYKIGAALALSKGLTELVTIARAYTMKPLIYDHQKAGTDIPDAAAHFVATLVDAGIDALIIFPQAGPSAQAAWTQAALDQGLGVLVGGYMTHPQYVASEGGYIVDDAIERIYQIAAGQGVTNYILPGNKPEVIATSRLYIESLGIRPVFYSPGLITQGGDLNRAAAAAGASWHAIVGRALYKSHSIRETAFQLTQNL